MLQCGDLIGSGMCASAFASEPSPVPLPGAYHVAPSPREVSTALQGRALSFNRSPYTHYHRDDDDASIMVVVPTASVVQENELFTGSIVETAPWEDQIHPAEVTESLSSLFPKDAVWIGKKRVRIWIFVFFVVIAAIVTGLTIALIQSEKNKDEGASASLSGVSDWATRSPLPFPPPSRPLQDQLKPTPTPSSDRAVKGNHNDNGSHNIGTGSGGGSSGSGGN